MSKVEQIKVSKVVALSKAKSRLTSLGSSFPVGLVALPVVGGIFFNIGLEP